MFLPLRLSATALSRQSKRQHIKDHIIISKFLFSTAVAPAYTRTKRQSAYHPTRRRLDGTSCYSVILRSRGYSQTKKQGRKGGQFFYRIAASYIAKHKKFDQAKHNSAFDSESGQHWLAGSPVEASRVNTNRKPSGQDACFMSPVGDSTAAAFGVADGVGGWVDQGIDSADFAHGLCNRMSDLAEGFPKGFEVTGANLSALELLQEGYNLVCDDETIAGGGSTACLGVAGPEGLLEVANLGDSGFIHLRDNKVHHHSDPQTHAFNTPYQLSHIPRKVLAQIEAFGGNSPLSDMPKDSVVQTHELHHGDVLVFGTDGVWDNLSSQDILAIVSDTMIRHQAWVNEEDGTQVGASLAAQTEGSQSPDERPPLQTLIATSVVGKAKIASMDRNRDGPFAKAVQRQYPNERFMGGKPDDICAVVAIVVDRDLI